MSSAQRSPAARPNTTFAIFGDGELRADLLAQAERLGVAQHLRMPGFRKDIPSILKALDLFVMPSHMEGLGTSVLDAMAAGVPVVGTEAGGMPESVIDEETGLLCPIRDGKAIAGAVLRLLNEPELAARCAENAGAKVRAEFSTESMVSGTVAVYEDLIGAPSESAP